MYCLPEHQSIAVEWVRDIWLIREEEPAAEAKKADGASWVTLHIFKPPDQTGRDASTLSRRLMFAMNPSKDLCRTLKSSSSEERKRGEVCKTYNIFGKENAWQSIMGIQVLELASHHFQGFSLCPDGTIHPSDAINR